MRGKLNRRSLRLPDYDYSGTGAYFLTLCTYGRECLFGEIENGEMRLNQFRRIVSDEWRRSAELRSEITLDVFVVMPNHLHGILFLDVVPLDARAHGRAPLQGRAPLPDRAPLWRPKRSLGSFVAGVKSIVTKRVNELRGTPRNPVWQRNYYEHVIRSDESLHKIRQYILSNPEIWSLDRENPACVVLDRTMESDSEFLP